MTPEQIAAIVAEGFFQDPANFSTGFLDHLQHEINKIIMSCPLVDIQQNDLLIFTFHKFPGGEICLPVLRTRHGMMVAGLAMMGVLAEILADFQLELSRLQEIAVMVRISRGTGVALLLQRDIPHTPYTPSLN